MSKLLIKNGRVWDGERFLCAASTVSYCIWYGIVKDGELSKLFIIKFAEPIFACIFGAIILNEDIWQIQYLAAFVLVSGAVWFSNMKFKKSETTL